MHRWGDADVDWKGINDAAYFIGDFCRKWGRMPVRDMKEKYGTVRVYTSIGVNCFLNITHPGYVHYRSYPRWAMIFDINHGAKVLRWSGLAWLFREIIHPHVYRLAYKKALQKWPHLKKEILVCADWPELMPEYYTFEEVEGGIDVSLKEDL